jgi:hypothetical protein
LVEYRFADGGKPVAGSRWTERRAELLCELVMPDDGGRPEDRGCSNFNRDDGGSPR